jgi:CRISPR/Cas system CSM-associated protein Csm3 (group 7 of RAMP superfamily)
MNGKIVLTGKLKLLSPLLIGSGNSDSTDLDVILDSEGNPFIAFTSFIGALRHHLKKNYEGINTLDTFFGLSKDDNTRESGILGTDFFISSDSKKIITTRDGIKIELTTGILKKGAKYDYQVVEKGSEFSFNLEAGYPVLTKSEDGAIKRER